MNVAAAAELAATNNLNSMNIDAPEPKSRTAEFHIHLSLNYVLAFLLI